MHDSQMPSRRICMYAMMSPLVFLTTPAIHNFSMHSCPGVCQCQGAASPVFLVHLPFILLRIVIAPVPCRKMAEAIPDVHKVLNTFLTDLSLVEIPPVWRDNLEGSPNGTCWYPAHISYQASPC